MPRLEFSSPRYVASVGAALSALIFGVATWSAQPGISASYGVVVALVGRASSKGAVVATAFACLVLTLTASLAVQSQGSWSHLFVDAFLPGSAILMALCLALRGAAEREVLGEKLASSLQRNRNAFQAAGVAMWEINFAQGIRRIEQVFEAGATDLAVYFSEHPEFARELMKVTIAVDVNDACMRMHGATVKDELLGPVDKVWPLEAEADFAEAVIAAVADVPFFRKETHLLKLDGQLVDVLYSAAYPPEAASREVLFVAFLDITDRNRAQAELEKMQTDLAHTTRLAALGELTASIVHEVSQPFGAILSNSQAGLLFLQRGEPDVDRAIGAVSGAVEAAQRGAEVLKGIKALARKDAAEFGYLCLNDVIKETLPLMRSELSRAKIELRVDLYSEMAPIHVDRIQIQQVVINLVLNSMQAMRSTRSARVLSVSTSMRAGEAVASIADSGPGVPTELQERLFTAFVTTRDDGMGLGLSLCASILERHGGRIWADFSAARGARFEFSIPAAARSETS